MRRIRQNRNAMISTKENIEAPMDKPIQPPIRAETKVGKQKFCLCIIN